MSEILIFEGMDIPRRTQRQIQRRVNRSMHRQLPRQTRGGGGVTVVEVGGLGGFAGGGDDIELFGGGDLGMEAMYREPVSRSLVFNVGAAGNPGPANGGFSGPSTSWSTVLTASGMVRTQTFWKNHQAWALALRTMANQKAGWARQHARGLLTVLKSLNSLGFGFGNGTKGTDYLVPYVDTEDIEYLMLKPEAVARLAKDISKPLSKLLGSNPYGQIMAYRQQNGIVSPFPEDSLPREKTGEDALSAALDIFNRNVDLPGGGSIPTSQEELEAMARRNAERAAAAAAEALRKQLEKVGVGSGGKTPAPGTLPQTDTPAGDGEGMKLWGMPWWLPVGLGVMGVIGIVVWRRRG